MTDQQIDISTIVAGLYKQLELETTQVTRIKTAIQALQDLCTHHWEYQGHSPNDDYYICSICKKDKWQ